MEYVAAACCLASLAAIVLILALDRANDRRLFRRFMSTGNTPVVCIRCQGRGWTRQERRTLTFTGDGFADVEEQATMCPACNGSGQVLR